MFYTYSELGDGNRAREGSSGGYRRDKKISERVENSELAKRTMGVISGKLFEVGNGFFQGLSDDQRDEIFERDLEIIADSYVNIDLKFRRRVSCKGFDFNEMMGKALYTFFSMEAMREYSNIFYLDRPTGDIPSLELKIEPEFKWEPGPARYGFILKKNFNLDD
jgi:hypothetical protein